MNDSGVVRVGFTVNAETPEPAYFRKKLGKRFVPFMPKWLLRALVWDTTIEYLRGHIDSVSMGRVEGIVSAATGARAELNFRAVLRTPEELAENPEYARALVSSAIQSGYEKDGLDFWGLGGFTSIWTRGGESLLPVMNPLGIHITTGNSLTTWSGGYETPVRTATLADLNLSESTVTIIGGRGSIGKVSAKLLAPMVGKVILVGRPDTDLTDAVSEVSADSDSSNVTWEPSLERAIRQSQIVISVASTTTELTIDPDWFQPRTIVVDVSRPRSIGDLLKVRKDVLVVAGGIYRLPAGSHSNFNFGLDPDEVLACMAETIVLALEGKTKRNYSIGADLEVSRVREIGHLASWHGLRMSKLRGTDDTVISDLRLLEFLTSSGLSDIDAARRLALFRDELGHELA